LKPANFEYHRPHSTDEVFSLLTEFGDDGKILAGGQSLMPLMNFRLAQPAHLIDINFIDGLDYIRNENGAIKIGCLTRQSRVLDEPLVRQHWPLLAEALTYVGYEQIRNRGTVCGSLAHADPAAELPAVLLALDGSVTVGHSAGRREIAARDFFQSYLSTALASEEMVLEASIPALLERAGTSFVEFARRFGDFAIVGVAVMLVASRDELADARIALTGVGDKPWRERKVEETLIGKKASSDLFSKTASEVAAGISPSADIHGSEAYRRSLANVLTRRALSNAWREAQNAR
jgi:CO/xanthine dehydrogenase FAD-binding subunit